MTTRRVNMADIAAEAGVSPATVCRALRNDSCVSPATRKRVQAVAERLNYRPDPMLSALVRRRTAEGVGTLETIAFLDPHPRKNLLTRNPYWREVHAGARKRAEQMGYALDYLWKGGKRTSGPRLSRILQSRGIRGVCVGPLSGGRGHLNLEWEKFCPVAVGYSMLRPQVHRAAPHHFHGALTVLRQLWKMGYRQPRIALHRNMVTRTDEAWQAAALTFALHHRTGNPFTALPSLEEDVVRRWFDETRPDVVVSTHRRVYDLLLKWKLRVPKDVGFATLSWRREVSHMAGLDQRPAAIGAAAIDLCIGQLQRNETGIPAIPKATLIEGVWVDGDTVRKKGIKERGPKEAQGKT